MPCPRWRLVGDALDDVAAFAAEVGWPLVLKTPRGGYDGKGVLVVDDPARGREPWLERSLGEPALLAEEQVRFRRELAVLVARSADRPGRGLAGGGDRPGRRDLPARWSPRRPASTRLLAAQATGSALRIAGELGVVGVLAVELFETAEPGAGGVVVNELAMRPHNSGHWTIDGAATSQFEQHLRAVLDLPLGDPRARAPWTVMVNVLGGDAGAVHRALLHVMARDPGAKVHLYGKAVRPGRKIGHVTVCGDDLADCRERARHAADFIAGTIEE